MEKDFRKQLSALLPRLGRFAFTLTRSRQDADDLVQMACERALRRVEQWRPDTRLDSWMFRIMQTIWYNELRSRKAQGRRDDSERLNHETAEDGQRLADARLTLSQVEERIMQLPEEQRVVLLLVCVEGLTYREAADITSTPIGTVMSRLARARLNLMKGLEQPQAELERSANNVIRLVSR